MKQGLKLFLAGTTVGVIMASGTNFASNVKDTVQRTFRDIKITMNGTTVNPTDANGKTVEPFIIDGTTYLPVRAVSNALGANVDWDGETSTVILTSEEKQKDADARYQEWLKNMKKSMLEQIKEDQQIEEASPSNNPYYAVNYFSYSGMGLESEENKHVNLRINEKFELLLNDEKIADNVIRCYAGYEGNGGPGVSIYYLTDDGTLYFKGYGKPEAFAKEGDWNDKNETHKLSIKNVVGFCGDYNFVKFIDIDGNIINWYDAE